MGAHLIDGEFQSDKYPTTPRGKVPLSVKDPAAQPFLWEYAQRHRSIDAEFSDDLETALRIAGYKSHESTTARVEELERSVRVLTESARALDAILVSAGVAAGRTHHQAVGVLVDRAAKYAEALWSILEISRDRAAFVMMGPRGFARAEQIVKAALGEAKGPTT